MRSCVSSPSPSELPPPGSLRDAGTPLHLDEQSPLPASWALAGVLAAVHVVSAVGWSAVRPRPLWVALLFDRPRAMRAGVGGQVDRLLEDGEWWRLATSCLLHADIVHLTLNAVSLVALGRLLEPLVGGWRLLAWFVLGGLGGSLTSWAAGFRYSDGASGGAFALLGAIAVIGWMERSHTLKEDRQLFGPVLWVFLAVNVVLSFLLPFIDVAGHLGGLAVGLMLGLWPGRRPGPPAWVDGLVVVAFLAVCAGGWGLLLSS